MKQNQPGLFKMLAIYTAILMMVWMTCQKWVPVEIILFLKFYWQASLVLVYGAFLGICGGWKVFRAEALYRAGERLKNKEIQYQAGELDYENFRRN